MMIDRDELKKELEEQLQGFIPEQYDLDKLRYKIMCSAPLKVPMSSIILSNPWFSASSSSCSISPLRLPGFSF